MRLLSNGLGGELKSRNGFGLLTLLAAIACGGSAGRDGAPGLGGPVGPPVGAGDAGFGLRALRTMEWGFNAAGLRQQVWQRPLVSPEGLAQFAENYWNDFIEEPALIFVEARR